MVGLMQSVSTLVPYISESLRSFNGRGEGKVGTDGLNQSIWMIYLILFGYMAESDFSRNNFSRLFSSILIYAFDDFDVFMLSFYCICPSLNKLY